jgi:hypothetical protein
MPLDEEAIKQDPDIINEEAHEAVTLRTGITSIATSANYKGIGKKNAEEESTKTNPAEMHKDEPTGRESTSWTKMPKPNPSMPSIMPKSKLRTLTKSYSTQS